MKTNILHFKKHAILAATIALLTAGPSRCESRFLANLPQGFVVPEHDDAVGWRVLAEYGAVFVARGGVTLPQAPAFPDEQAVIVWQSSVKSARTSMWGIVVELQNPAMDALLAARREARAAGLNITPRAKDAARRSYADTVRLWQSRINPGLAHWVEAGRLASREAACLGALSPAAQVGEILRLEREGLYFSLDFSKSVLRSVAPPGATQHLSMLAFDVEQHEDARVRSILGRHGWFQTVLSDRPHFTFLGVAEKELPSLGLKKISSGGRTYWVPDLDVPQLKVLHPPG